MAEPETAPIASLYPPELVKVFPDFPQQVDAFLARNRGVSATIRTAPEAMARYADELTELARTLRDDLKNTATGPTDLYHLATAPSQLAGAVDVGTESPVGVMSGSHRYHILYKTPVARGLGRDLLLLLQRLPRGLDTGAEIHGLVETKDQPGHYQATDTGGAEVYIPLTDGIVFYVNGREYRPKALADLIRVFPGDIHHHHKEQGRGPARVLIVAGLGMARWPKVPQGQNSFQVEGFGQVPVTAFNHIPRLVT